MNTPFTAIAIAFVSLLNISAIYSNPDNDEWNRQYLARQIVDECDTNKDGILSSEEMDKIVNRGAYKKAALAFLKSSNDHSTKAFIAAYQIPKNNIVATRHSNVEYKRVGDRRVLMDIYLPKTKTKKPMPVALFLHGGGWHLGNKNSINGASAFVVQGLLDKGIAVAAANYRLVRPDGNSHVEDCISDVKDALAFINREGKHYGFDTSKTFVWGQSAGAHLTMMLAYSDLEDFVGDAKLRDYRIKPHAIISYYGAGSFEMSENFDSIFLRRFTPSTETSVIEEKLREASPTTHIDSTDPPSLILSGDKDVIVKVEQAYSIERHLKQHGVEHKLIIVKNAGHGWMKANDKPIEPSVEGITKITIDYILQNSQQ